MASYCCTIRRRQPHDKSLPQVITVNKMPLLMQKSIALGQEQMKVLLPKMMAILQKGAQEAK